MDDDDSTLGGTGLHESLLGDEDEPLPPVPEPARRPVTAAAPRVGLMPSKAHDAYVQLSSTEGGAPEVLGEVDRDRERHASEVAMARQVANAKSFQQHIAGEEEALKKIVRQEEKDMEMAMRLQLEAENDMRSHSLSQEESDAQLAARLQARFGDVSAMSAPTTGRGNSVTQPPVTKKVTVRVTVPPGVAPGEQLVVNVPNHAKYNVTVPEGAREGAQFLVEITSVINVTITVSLDNKQASAAGPPPSPGPSSAAAPPGPAAPPPASSGAAEPPLPSGWERATLPDGRVFYVCHRTKTTHWSLPELPAEPPPYPGSEGGPPAASVAAAAPPPAPSSTPSRDDTVAQPSKSELVKQIMEAGFSEDQALCALAIDHVHTAEDAVIFLLDQA